MDRLIGLIGMAFMLGVAWLLSLHRKNFPWRTVAWGFGLQLIFALIILKTYPGKWIFEKFNDIILTILSCSDKGAEFVFGNLINRFLNVGTMGANGQFINSEGSWLADAGTAFFAFKVLPTIIFFSAFMTILYHYGIMQKIVLALAKLMAKTMKTSGAESLSASANIFVGQTEAPLVVKPYVNTMTKSELNAIMVGGFATIAGGVMAAYVGLLKEVIPNIAGHLMSASIMSAPAGLAFAKVIIPETEEPLTRGQVKLKIEKIDANGIDAASRGATDGLKLALNVGAMLIAFIGLITLINIILGMFWKDLSLTWIFSKSFAPLAWMMGIPWNDCAKFGDILGTQITMNEFVAYLKLHDYAPLMSQRAAILGTYAMCGFANFSSVGIQLGGIGGIAPERRSDLARIALRALVAGAFASWCTCCIAGILI
jgi:concentrative nucleoside transporter, CNT family